MSSSIISSVESITRNNENDFALDAKRKQSIDSMREMGEYANENILLINARKSQRIKSHRLKASAKIGDFNGGLEEEYDSFWVDSGKTRLGLQFERCLIVRF